MKKKEQTEGRKRVGKFELFHPANLQRQIDSYGYSFSMGRYCVFLSVSVTCAVGCGLLRRRLVYPERGPDSLCPGHGRTQRLCGGRASSEPVGLPELRYGAAGPVAGELSPEWAAARS